jgi:hypothetical protein
MKKALLLLAAVAMAAPAVFAADGSITFYNRNYQNAQGGNMDGLTGTTGGVVLDTPTGVGAGTLGAGVITVGIFKVGSETPLATQTLRTAPAGFQSVFAAAGDIVVTGSPVNTTAQLFLRGWVTADGSFAASRAAGHYAGESATFTSLALGGNNAPNPDVTALGLTGFTGLVLTVPEPSTYALAFTGIGALAMMARRRK